MSRKSWSLCPVIFKVIRQVRPKLSLRRIARLHLVQAPAPSRPVDRGLAGPGLLAHVLVFQVSRITCRFTARRKSTPIWVWN